MSSNSLIFYTSGSISSSPAIFLFFLSLSTETWSSCVNYPSLISRWLLMVLGIALCVTLGGFPCKFSKCCFHMCIHSSWLAAFSIAFSVLFLLLTSFNVCHAILDCLASTKSLILLIWFCMYSFCSFRYMLDNSFCAFLCFRVLILIGFLLLRWQAILRPASFFNC